MKLRNKKTGKVIEWFNNTDDIFPNTLAELNEDWEDYEEPKTFWAISWAGEPEEYDAENAPQELKDMARSIGNYFESKEEAEKAVEKLKAWKRLKDKGFRFDGFYDKSKQHILWHCGLPYIIDDEFYKDLDLLFGGEK